MITVQSHSNIERTPFNSSLIYNNVYAAYKNGERFKYPGE